ncbi:MAG TPA: type II toxin-antitoxin system VapC family toxin [Thermoleophilaceae bacterium]|nr:type II toxin-antitoxin system VapC family toxin [Thermoleophilaceae bacterium]
MRFPDTNVLLNAVNEDAPRHDVARDWLNGALSDTEAVGFAWLGLLGFLRIATKQAVFANPLTPVGALDLIDDWLARPQATLLHPSDRHLSVLRELTEKTGTAGDLTSDAHLAAIAIEHGARLATFDTDFYRFKGLRLDYLG